MGEKKKYIATLSSVGASKAQIIKIYLIQGLIITIIAIPLGLVFSYGLDYLLINVFDKLFETIQGNILNTTLEVVPEINLRMVWSWIIVCISSLLVTIIVFISILAPIVNASKTTIMDMIRKTKFNKISKSSKRTPKCINKLFKVPGVLAYKNIKRSRYKFVTMIISLTISIVLFISITGYIENLGKYNKIEELDYNYTYYTYNNTDDNDYKTKSQEVAEMIDEFGLADDMYELKTINPMYLVIDSNNVNDSLKQAYTKFEGLSQSLRKKDDGSIEVLAHIIKYDDKSYEEYLKNIGLNMELKKDECILVNYSDVSTKYYDGLYLTNYKTESKIVMNTQSRDENMETLNQISGMTGGQVASNKSVELTIKAVTNIIPRGIINNVFGSDIYLIVNEDTYKDAFYTTMGIEMPEVYEYRIKTSNPQKLDELINTLNNKYNNTIRIYSNNLAKMQQSNENEQLIKEILLYSFLVLIGILSIINVFNITISNIRIRKNELAELSAIGMSKKQMNKMLRLEGVFYGIISLFIGFIISIIILYILYGRMMDTQLYAFEIPLKIFVPTIIVVFCVIFVSIWYAKRQFKNENIADIIDEKL